MQLSRLISYDTDRLTLQDTEVSHSHYFLLEDSGRAGPFSARKMAVVDGNCRDIHWKSGCRRAQLSPISEGNAQITVL